MNVEKQFLISANLILDVCVCVSICPQIESVILQMNSTFWVRLSSRKSNRRRSRQLSEKRRTWTFKAVRSCNVWNLCELQTKHPPAAGEVGFQSAEAQRGASREESFYVSPDWWSCVTQQNLRPAPGWRLWFGPGSVAVTWGRLVPREEKSKQTERF